MPSQLPFLPPSTSLSSDSRKGKSDSYIQNDMEQAEMCNVLRAVTRVCPEDGGSPRDFRSCRLQELGKGRGARV